MKWSRIHNLSVTQAARSSRIVTQTNIGGNSELRICSRALVIHAVEQEPFFIHVGDVAGKLRSILYEAGTRAYVLRVIIVPLYQHMTNLHDNPRVAMQ